MAAADPSFEMAMLPGMVEVKAGVIPSLVVAYPLAVVVDVRCFGMALVITEIRFRGIFMWRLARSTVIGWRAVVGNKATADAVASTATVTVLRPKGHRKKENNGEEPER